MILRIPTRNHVHMSLPRMPNRTELLLPGSVTESVRLARIIGHPKVREEAA